MRFTCILMVVRIVRGIRSISASLDSSCWTGAALIDYWRERLPEGERAVLDVCLSAKGAEIAREAIDERTGYKRSSRDAYLTRLKARGLVEFSGRGTVLASQELFD